MGTSERISLGYSVSAWKARQRELRDLVGYFQEAVDIAVQRNEPADEELFKRRRDAVVGELDRCYPEGSIVFSGHAHYRNGRN